MGDEELLEESELDPDLADALLLDDDGTLDDPLDDPSAFGEEDEEI